MQNDSERVVCMADNGLKNVIANLEKTCTELKRIEVFSEYEKDLQNILEHTKEPLMIMVMGAFSTGKSSFINALVGEEIAAVEAKPTTAVVTKLCYGNKDVLKVYFRDGKSTIYSPSEFAKLTAVNDVEADNSIHEKIDYVERQMPIEMLKQVTIIDSPGLNDVNEKHSEASERFVKNADSVLWMFSALQMGSKFEIEAMDKLTPRLKPIAIINKMDQINDDEDDTDEFLAKAKALLKDKVQAVIGISAKYALQGKLENNKLKSQVGNLDELKNAIETLVVPNREAFKLNTLLDELGYFFAAFNNELRSFKENNKEIGHNDYKLYVQNVKIALRTEEILGLIVDTILEYCEREAGRRNEQAMFLLGVLYDGGIGVLQDEEKAMQFYRAAALKNHLGAMQNMYVYYREGTSDENKQSLFWLQKLAEAGDDEAQFDYAIYLMKKGDKEAAFNWCKKAAEQGNASAQFGLYRHYDNGIGVEEDEDIAFEWLEKAVEQEIAVALLEYGKYYADEKEEVVYFKKAAEQGLTEAQYNLAGCLFKGRGIDEDKAEAYKWFRKAAEQGHAVAQTFVGGYLEEGWANVTKNEKEAVEWYRKAAEQGFDFAQTNLANCLYNGRGVTDNKAEAYKWYRKAAEQGHADAQNMVGRYLEEGWGGIAKDEYEAVEWFRKAAEQGYDVAQNNLANCLYLGRGVGENKAEAYKWFKKAAEQDHVNAQYAVGLYYELGLGDIEKDLSVAVEWYKKAAEQGHKDAQFKLGQFLCEGKGTAKDEKEGLVWYRKAAEQGHAEAMYKLGECYRFEIGVSEDKAEAYKWYHKAAEQGYVEAMCKLGECYYFELGVAEDEAEAYKWYRKAAEQGHKESQNIVGRYLEEGWANVTKNEKEAVEWYRKAAEQGFISAQGNLANCLDAGRGVAQDKFEAYRWYSRAAEQGYAEAQNMVGRYLEEGWGGLNKNLNEAVAWYSRAAEQGHIGGQFNLAVCLYYGQGVAEDKVEAYKLFRKIAEKGIAIGQRAVGDCYFTGSGVSEDKREAYEWYCKAVEQGDAYSENVIGRYLEYGWGVVGVNPNEAFKWYLRAAEKGNDEAQWNLSLCYEKGIGVAIDKDAADKWRSVAADNGNIKAIQALENNSKSESKQVENSSDSSSSDGPGCMVLIFIIAFLGFMSILPPVGLLLLGVAIYLWNAND